MINNKTIIRIASIACFIGCIGDFWITFVLGNYDPGYSQLHNTMSALGISSSPVSGIISTWWILLGILMIIFAYGLGKAFGFDNRYVKLAAILLVLYGLGEGFGSGIFKADHVKNSLTDSAIVHEIMGGIGVAAIVIFPLAMNKVIPRTNNPGFHILSLTAFIVGLFFLTMFLIRILPEEPNKVSLYKGLWQRLFVLDYYLYMMVIAVIMIKKQQVNPH
jgi:hypothetical protein